MKITMTQLRRLIKEAVTTAMTPMKHAADCNYGTDDTFICDTCGNEVCWCQGAADDTPNTCDDCSEKLYR